MDLSRHIEVFKPFEYHNMIKKTHIIGVGATGGRIALSLSKLGIENIVMHDYDVVESHNIPNQVFHLEHIGKTKISAMKEIVKSMTGIEICGEEEKISSCRERLSGVIFLLTDTMSSRKEIWENSIKNNTKIELMIETRMGINSGRIYCINPLNIIHIENWEKSLYDDKNTEVSACGSSISVGPTADCISAFAVWSLITWYHYKKGGKVEEPANVTFIGLEPFSVHHFSYSS